MPLRFASESTTSRRLALPLDSTQLGITCRRDCSSFHTMAEEQVAPLSIKERMAQLAAHSNSSATAPPPTTHKAAAAATTSPRPTTPSTLDSVGSLLANNLNGPSSSSASSARTAVTTLSSAYPPLSPTLSASSSRPASPYKSPPSAQLNLDPSAQSASIGRQRAGSSASALSAFSVGSHGGSMEMGKIGAGVADKGLAVKSVVSPPPRERGSSPELPLRKVDTSSSSPRKPPTRGDSESLMAFSPTVDEGSSTFPPSSASTSAVASRPPQVPPPRRSTISSTSSRPTPSSTSSTSTAPTLPPRFPPRRSATSSSMDPPSPTASTYSLASASSTTSQGPALPPRPRAPSSVAAATPPRPTPSRPSYARHSPKSRQPHKEEGFESISLTSAGGAELAHALASGAAHPLASPSLALPTKTTATGKQRPLHPRARKRYDALFEQCLRVVEARGGGAPKPAWVKTGGGEEEGRVPGEVVRVVWARSRLEEGVLRGIWCVAFLHARRRAPSETDLPSL